MNYNENFEENFFKFNYSFWKTIFCLLKNFFKETLNEPSTEKFHWNFVKNSSKL